MVSTPGNLTSAGSAMWKTGPVVSWLLSGKPL